VGGGTRGRVGRGMERCVGLSGESIEVREKFGERRRIDGGDWDGQGGWW